MKIAYFSDKHHVEYWDQLRVVYRLDGVYEIEGKLEDENEVTGWHVVADPADIVADHVIMFNPKSSPTFPGAVSLAEFEHPSGDVVYVFGSDMRHSDAFPVESCVYIDMPKDGSLWSFQAAAVVLQDRFRRGG